MTAYVNNNNDERNDTITRKKEMRHCYGHSLQAGAIRDGRIKYCINNNHKKKTITINKKVNAPALVQPCEERT